MKFLQSFSFKGHNVRTVNKDGEAWFVLNDACSVLNLAPRVVKQRLSKDVCSTYPLQTAGGTQDTTIINEDGLYDVILESRKPEAKTFRKWVTSDVLPTIRKHGAYMTPETIERTLTDPDFIINLATELKTERTARLKAEEQIQADRPKVIFADSLLVSKDSILVNDLAKLLKQNGIDIGGNRLFRYLREEGYLIKSGSQYNMPTQRSMEMKLFEVKVGTRQSSDGTSKITRTPKVTAKGQVYFINKFKRQSKGA